MKVKDCIKCMYYWRRTWSQKYKPANYHAIGISHAYAFCLKYNKRCLKVLKSQCKDGVITPKMRQRISEISNVDRGGTRKNFEITVFKITDEVAAHNFRSSTKNQSLFRPRQ